MKTKIKTIVCWDCGDDEHWHRSKTTAEKCARVKKRTVRMPELLKQRAIEHRRIIDAVNATPTIRQAAKDLGLSVTRVHYVYTAGVRQAYHELAGRYKARPHYLGGLTAQEFFFKAAERFYNRVAPISIRGYLSSCPEGMTDRQLMAALTRLDPEKYGGQ